MMCDDYHEFYTKKPCEEFCNANGLVFYQKDLNGTGQKIFVATSHKCIYEKIFKENRPTSYYESWNINTPMKFFIDYDRKCKDDNKNTDAIHKTDIHNIISYVFTALSTDSVTILKSIPDTTKKSYHLIFDKICFNNYKSMKVFVEGKIKPQFKELFDNKIIDASVYTPKCFRSLGSTKFGQNRPLFLLKTESFMNNLNEDIIPNPSFEEYEKSCITDIKGTELFTYKNVDKRTTSTKKIYLHTDQDIYGDKDIIKKYLDILDPSRYIDRNKWLNVGYILYSISSENLDVWLYFSSKWESFNEEEAKIAWYSLSSSDCGHTIYNLIYLANLDNPNDCIQLQGDIPKHDIKYLRPFDNVISKLIYRMYGEKFVCSNPEKNEWYHFNGIRWNKENKNFNLRVLIINEVFQKVEEYRKQLIKDNADEEIIKTYHTILKILGSGTRLNCLELEFYNSNFYKIIDQRKYLIGFDNGVYDLETYTFRKGVASDYISLSTNYIFTEYNETCPLWNELEDIIEKIIPDPDTRLFILKALASTLDGYTRDEKFYIFAGKNGIGGSGKSTISDLLLQVLGDYGGTAPVTLMTSKRESANNANSALVNIRNKRAIIMGEPEAHDCIQAGTMKALTGGDKVSTRELHATQIEFKPHAKFMINVNKIPPMSDYDGGVMRRTLVTEFTSKFVDEPKEPNEFKINRDLKNKLVEYAPVFFCMLVKYYKIYREEGLRPPEIVTKVTLKYELVNNAMKQFINERIKPGGYMTRDEVQEAYKSDMMLKSQFPSCNRFYKQLENTLGVEFEKGRNNIVRIKGFSFRLVNDTEDSDDESEECDIGHLLYKK